MRLLGVITLFILAVLSSVSAVAGVFNAKTYTLENGLQVVLVENFRAPVVTHMVWYKAGAVDEPRGTSGIAHFMEHLMFKGNQTYAPGEFSRRVKQLGGQDNAFTSQDYTAYFQSIAVRNLEDVMTMEADRMKDFTPPDKEVMSERDVILEERRTRTENDPRTHFSEQMRYMLYPNHPYGLPVIGWREEMETLSPQDAKNFHKKFYAPNNAILVVSGAITLEDLKPIVQKTYGQIPARTVPERTDTPIPSFPGQPRFVLTDPSLQQPSLTIAWRVESCAQNKYACLAYQVMESILSDGQSARLYKSLVVDQQLAVNAGFSYQGDSLYQGSAWLYATPKEGVKLEDLEAALLKEISKIVETPPGPEETDTAKARMIDRAIYARDSLSGPAMVIGRALTTGSTLYDIENWPQDIESITPDMVQIAARRMVEQMPEPVVGIINPRKIAAKTE